VASRFSAKRKELQYFHVSKKKTMIERRMANSRFSGEEKVLSSMEPELKKTMT
jgi:hypothetical protein